MEQKSFVLTNGGMNRDLSVSKAGKSSVFENRNIRVESRENDTLLSITNERGTKEVKDLTFEGTLVGWNVLNQYLILFTAETVIEDEEEINVSRIYRVKYDDTDFASTLIFEGNLGFSVESPIESIVDYETETIQKIYWVDGIHVLRYLNFSDQYLTDYLESGTLYDNPVFKFRDDITWFDSTRASSIIPTCQIVKSNESANARPNGNVQYFLTYFNKHGQQTGIVYSSPVVYLSPVDRGGAADETNNNTIKLFFSGLDTKYEFVRLYQIVRTTANIVTGSYLVAESDVLDGEAEFVDDGTNLGTVDASSFLYLGGQEVVAGTMAQKDSILFLGDIKSVGQGGTGEIDEKIKETAFYIKGSTFQYDVDWESKIVEFVLTNNVDTSAEDCNIPNVYASGYYPYINQLNYTNAQISTFKGGEKYRFALRFFRANGTASNAFWIGDKVNYLYPKMHSNRTISRAIAKCVVPQEVITAASAAGFVSAQLLVAQATNSDRSVLVQGIVSPTVFNLYNRYKGLSFAQTSWIYRPKQSDIPHTHFSGLASSESSLAELQCVKWADGIIPSPLYDIDDDGKIEPNIENINGWSKVQLTVTIRYSANGATGGNEGYSLNNFTVKYFISSDLQNPSKVYGPMSTTYTATPIASWQRFYDMTSFPYGKRLSTQDLGNIIKQAKTSQNHYHNYDTGIIDIDGESIGYDYAYSNYNRDTYFIDESIVTLNSPEIDNFEINTDRNDGLKFRIVGASGIVSNISDYIVEADTVKYDTAGAASLDFSNPVISDKPNGIISWPLYREKAYNSSNDYSAFILYMWQRNGGITDYVDSTQTVYSDLKKKTFANLRFGFYTAYNNYKTNEWSTNPIDIRQINDISSGLYQLKTGVGNIVTYSSGYDEMVQMPEDKKYPVLYTPDVPKDADYTAVTEKEVSNPIQISYSSRPHAVISLGNVILPYLKNESAPDYPGKYASWADDISNTNYKLLYRPVDFGDPVEVARPEAGSFGNFNILEQDAQQHTATLSIRDNGGMSGMCQYLINAQDEIKKRAGLREQVFAHIQVGPSGSDDWWMMNLLDFTAGRVVVSAKLLSLVTRKSVDFSVDSPYPIQSIEWTILTENSEEKYYASITQSEMPELAAGKCKTEAVFVGEAIALYSIRYIIIFDVPAFQGNPLVPTIDTTDSGYIELGKLVYFKRNTHDICITAENASYEVISDLPDGDSYIDIVDGANAILTFDGNAGEFKYDGRLSKEYTRPAQTVYALPDDSLVGDEQCLLIGELYHDYDEECKDDPSKDIRYGGISSQAIENNIFITAGSRKMLSDTESVGGYTGAVLDVKTLYNYCVQTPLGRRRIAAWISTDGETFYKEISLSRITQLNPQGMTLADFAYLVVQDINIVDASITAEVDGNDNILLVVDPSMENEYTSFAFYYYRSAPGALNPWHYISGSDFARRGESQQLILIGNEGDTYFQRYDSIKTLPAAENQVNQVVEIASVMLESHINLDGRTDKYRNTRKIATLDWSKFGTINSVYTQNDNFITSREQDEALELDTYPSSIIWTLPKAAAATIDEWTHITLASSLTLDGDRGACNAIRKFKNSLIAFQNKGIAEILFNSSTPLSTESGLPVELANSGKVEGKRYVSGNYGCLNKWSIVEGKTGVFFIDNINKSFDKLAIDRSGYSSRLDVTNLSASLGFSAWFRKKNSLKTWTPDSNNTGFDNVVSYYDRVHSDVYLVSKEADNEAATLVFNEDMGAFTSFFDYEKVPMMTNVRNKFLAFKGDKLWQMHEGKFNTFFGSEYSSSVVYRVSPEPYSDKIWTNIDSRFDFFKAFESGDDEYLLPEGVSVNHLADVANDLYQPNDKLDSIQVWNEYQKTIEDTNPAFDKTFRIWRYQIPRAYDENATRVSMDRIRNPWIYIKFKKLDISKLMVIHDIVVRYFE